MDLNNTKDFIKTYNHYCKNHACTSCKIGKITGFESTTCMRILFKLSSEQYDEVISTLNDYLAINPIKTRQSELLKIFPNTQLSYEEYIVDICPMTFEPDLLGFNSGLCNNIDCHECKKSFWFTEID